MMEQDFKQETRIRQYLLGELTLEEQVLLEQRLFLESEYAELAQGVEDELVDDYLHDDLTGGERKKFEDHFLGQPEHRAELKIAEALEKYLTSEVVVEPGKTTGFTFIRQVQSFLVSLFTRHQVVSVALAAALLIVVSTITWKTFKSMRAGRGEPPLQANDRQPPKVEPTNQPSPSAVVVNGNKGEEIKTGPPEKDRKNQIDQQRSPVAIATFEILPGGLSRSGGRHNSVRISPEIKTVILKLPLDFPEPYARYHYELLSGGRIIDNGYLKSPTDPSEPAVSITLPVKSLKLESYEIKVRGITADERSSAPSSYFFTVERTVK